MNLLTIFRCPVRGMNVQWSYTAADPTDDGLESFEPVECPACGRMHLFNRSTGKLRGDDASRPRSR